MTAPYRHLVAGALLIPAIGLSAAVSVLMAAHERPIPVVPNTAKFDQTDHAWQMQHVLVDGCPCSESVARHLLNRRPMPGVIEHVYLIADDPQAQTSLMRSLRQLGFETTVMNISEAKRTLGVGGGPILLVRNDKGLLVYAGGYGAGRPSSRSGPDFFQDQNMVRKLQRGGDVVAYPVMGCSVAQTPTQVWAEFSAVFGSEGGK